MNNLKLGQKIVAIHIALGGRMHYEFHDYCGPHNPNHHATPPCLCELTCVNPEEGHFAMTRFWSGTAPQGPIIPLPHPTVIPVTNSGHYMHYYEVPESDQTRPREMPKYWLNADHYIWHLGGIVDEAVLNEDPYIHSKESYFRRLREAVLRFKNNEGPYRDLFDPPAFSIPMSRYVQFCSNYVENPPQRWGQAFYEFMQAHRCTQDAWWWDRVYNASEKHAQSMVKAVLDFNN